MKGRERGMRGYHLCFGLPQIELSRLYHRLFHPEAQVIGYRLLHPSTEGTVDLPWRGVGTTTREQGGVWEWGKGTQGQGRGEQGWGLDGGQDSSEFS